MEPRHHRPRPPSCGQRAGPRRASASCCQADGACLPTAGANAASRAAVRVNRRSAIQIRGGAAEGRGQKGLSDSTVVEEKIISVKKRPLVARAALTHEGRAVRVESHPSSLHGALGVRSAGRRRPGPGPAGSATPPGCCPQPTWRERRGGRGRTQGKGPGQLRAERETPPPTEATPGADREPLRRR